MKKRLMMTVGFLLSAISTIFAQGNGAAGITEATQMVTSYFDPVTKLKRHRRRRGDFPAQRQVRRTRTAESAGTSQPSAIYHQPPENPRAVFTRHQTSVVMRNILKAATLENKFPLLAVEHDCIISKDADLTVAYRVELPELFSE